MLEGDEERVSARVQLALCVAETVVCLEEEKHRRGHTSADEKGDRKCLSECGGRGRKLDALEHVDDLGQVLLRVAAYLRPVGCSVSLTKPAARGAGANHVAPRTVGEHGGEQGVVVAHAQAETDLRNANVTNMLLQLMLLLLILLLMQTMTSMMITIIKTVSHLPYSIRVAQNNCSPQLSIHAHETRRQLPARLFQSLGAP